MQIRQTIPADSVDERTLGAALEASTEIAQTQIEQGRVPPLADAIDQGVRWKPEPTPPGQESFDLPQTVLERGWGDCDDLAPWWAAELRASNVDPDAQAIVYKSRPRTWHVVVQRGDGSIDDPSRWAGMGQRVAGKTDARIPMTRPLASTSVGGPLRMTIEHGESPVVGIGRTRDGRVRARMDVPVVGASHGVTVTRIGQDIPDALAGLCDDAAIFALWGASDHVLARLQQIAGVIHGSVSGCDPELLGEFVCGLADYLDRQWAAEVRGDDCPPGYHREVWGLTPVCVPDHVSGADGRFAPWATHRDPGLRGKGAPPWTAHAPHPRAGWGASSLSGDYLERCPPGYHWERHGSVDVCVPDPVNGSRVGATTKVSVDPSAAANIAATILDPLGIRNIVAPLASQFVSSYAQGLAQKTPTSATITAQPSSVGRTGSSSRGGRGGARGGAGRGAGGGGRGRGGAQAPYYGGGGSQYDDSSQYGGGDMYGGYGYGGGYGYDPTYGGGYGGYGGAAYDPSQAAALQQQLQQLQYLQYMQQLAQQQAALQSPGYYPQQPYAAPYGAYGAPGGYGPSFYSYPTASQAEAAQYGQQPGYSPQQYAYAGY